MTPEKFKDEDSILVQLKKRTAHQHQSTEGTVNLLSEDFSLEDYRGLLIKFYSFYKAFEEQLKNALAKSPIGLDYSKRLNSPLLATDLSALGLSEEEIRAIPPAQNINSFETPEQIYGALYVVEGSTLGGQVIARHLKEKFQLDEKNGASFFAGYGQETGKMWNEFRESISGFVEKGADKEQIIESANNTFAQIGESLT